MCKVRTLARENMTKQPGQIITSCANESLWTINIWANNIKKGRIYNKGQVQIRTGNKNIWVGVTRKWDALLAGDRSQTREKKSLFDPAVS